MTRHQFGQSPTDWTFTVGTANAATLAGGITLTMWDLPTSGTQYTDLLTGAGSPIAAVTSSTGSDGLPLGTVPLFYGPDGVTEMWADAGGGYRSRITAHDAFAPSDDARFAQVAGATFSGSPAAGRTLIATSGSAVVWGDTGAINAKAVYGATGDGTTDDTTAIQAALNSCPAGGIVLLPQGIYRTSAPLRIPPYITLMGSHGGGEAQNTSSPRPSAIRPLASFSGAAVIAIVDQSLGSYATIASEIAIRDLTIDGSALPAGSVHGIQMTGQIQHVTLRDVQVRKVTGNGIDTAYNLSAPPGPQAPFCLHFNRVSVLWAGGTGITLNNSTDSTFVDVYALGCSSWGWFISGAAGSTWVACRAEWSGTDGFQLAGNNGVQTFIGCSTDRSAHHGFNVAPSSDTGLIVLAGCRATRDGASSTSAGYAGLNVASNTRPVIASDLVVTTGTNDDGSGLLTPQYGVSASGSAYVTVASGKVTGVSTGWHDGGSNTVLLRGPLLTGTGITSWSAGSAFAIKEGTNARMGTAVLTGTTAVTVANTSVTASTRIFLTINGPGGTPGTPYVSAVTAGTSFQIKSTGASDTSTVAWVLLEPA